MNKKVIIVITAMAVMVVLIAIGAVIIFNEDEFANWKTYRNERYGFEFKYPSNFYADGIILRDEEISIDEWEWGSLRMMIESNPDKKSPKDWQDNPNYPSIISDPNYDLLEELNLDGKPAIKLRSKYTVGDEDILVVFVAHGNYMIQLNMPILNNSYYNIFNQIISTFKFLD